jgi:cytochrome c-type biogenesis protein CcsB
MQPIDRGVFEKELIKVDERVNICTMVFGRRLMRLFPIQNDPNNRWISPGESASQHTHDEGMDELSQKFYPAYAITVQDAVNTQNWDLANELITELGNYQRKVGGEILPGQKKVDLEIWLNKMNIFARLGKWYGLLGFAFLIMFFTRVFRKQTSMQWPRTIALAILGVLFIAHTAGLGVRWYVSGHAPWSNGYESMIYIAWTTMLAGLIFARKSLGGLAATLVLASTILMVAVLSYMDPEITPLVPVLRSYWLTIHVSLEAGSYGFLMLAAIIGVLNLILMIFANQKNKERVYNSLKEMTYISEMTLIIGIIMISVGTYLGGVWANESWGRYWGWDAKETWALVTILVYAFILHMRFIPGLRGIYAFNVASLFGFASVIMTYFGVNYYLSGLHSYATGDPAPIPSYVYYTAAILLLISLLAYWRHRMNKVSA